MDDRRETVSSLGSWIRRRRKALDLTQSALAHRVACAEVTIRKIEANVMRPSHTIAARLAGGLDLPPDECAVFLQVARGERGVERLSTPLIGLNGCLAASDPVSATQPCDPIPVSATPPPGSRMPLSRNPLFVGRDATLRRLAQTLCAGEASSIAQPSCVAVTGLGGIGKTQLACEFVYRYGQLFPGGVFWLSFVDPATATAEVAVCGGIQGLQLSPEFDKLPLDEQVQRVIAAWSSDLPRLLVFDNCEEEALLQQWRPIYGGCRVLLTSRRHHWDPALDVRAVRLDVLTRSDSVTLLRAFRPDLSADDDLMAIAETLGDLPLALHLAGSFLAKYRHALTPGQYRTCLQTSTTLDDRSLRAAGLSPTKHIQHVARTFEQSYEQLDPNDRTDRLACLLLGHAACFAPGEPLPRWLLLSTLELPEDDLDRTLLAEDALTRLIDLGLLETDTIGILRLHRLLVAFVQAVLMDRLGHAAVEAAMQRVVDGLNEQRDPRPVVAIQHHLRFVTEAARRRGAASASELCHALGQHLWQIGSYTEAQSYLEWAVADQRAHLGEQHPATARSLHALGVTLWSQGQAALAQGYLEQAVTIRQCVLGEDHPDTARSLNNLGGVLQLQGQYAMAQRYYQQAAAICQRVLGNDHPYTAMSLNNLGMVFYEQGAFATAQHYYEQALAIQQRTLGSDHPDTAAILDNLGKVFSKQGVFAAAQHYYEQALAIQQRTLGSDHPLTAMSLYHLGEVLRTEGQYAPARACLEQALTIQQQVLGADHPDTARSLRGLGLLLLMDGCIPQACHNLEHALAIFTTHLGTQHPDTDQTRQILRSVETARAVAE